MGDDVGLRQDVRPLLGLPPAELRAALLPFLRERGEPAYRSRQIEARIFGRAAASFEEMTELPIDLREALADRFGLTRLEPVFTARSADGTVKHLWRMEDGEQVESVLIPSGRRVTLCLSSQAGCALGCSFCATGHFGFRRQLDAAEIAAQYREALRASRREFGRPVSHVVYMGMGEPLANLEATLASLQVLHEGFVVGARRITVSTVGLVPGILALARRPEPFRLAISLHAANHELRLRLMPIEGRYPLPELLDALREYAATKGRRLTFEITLIKGVNDDPERAEEVADISTGLPVFVNLIPFNPIPYVEWTPSSPERIALFAAVLERRGVPTALRTPRGRDIAAACGQLRLERGAPAA